MKTKRKALLDLSILAKTYHAVLVPWRKIVNHTFISLSRSRFLFSLAESTGDVATRVSTEPRRGDNDTKIVTCNTPSHRSRNSRRSLSKLIKFVILREAANLRESRAC